MAALLAVSNVVLPMPELALVAADRIMAPPAAGGVGKAPGAAAAAAANWKATCTTTKSNKLCGTEHSNLGYVPAMQYAVA